MLYKYFNETNHTMREFAEENTQLIAALSQQHDITRQLQQENKQLIAALSQEHNLSLENNSMTSNPWEAKYHTIVRGDDGINRALDLRSDMQKMRAQYTEEAQRWKAKYEATIHQLNSIENTNHINSEVIRKNNLEIEDLQDAYQNTLLVIKQLKNEIDSKELRDYDELKEAHSNVVKDKSTLTKAIMQRNNTIKTLEQDNIDTKTHLIDFINTIASTLDIDHIYCGGWDTNISHAFEWTRFMRFTNRTIEEIKNRDKQISYHHTFIRNVIGHITGPNDHLRLTNFHNIDEIYTACKNCIGILNIWSAQRCDFIENTFSEPDSQDDETEYTTQLQSHEHNDISNEYDVISMAGGAYVTQTVDLTDISDCDND